MQFNKKEFGELLEKAKGNRTINKYASDAKVDAGYISRLIRGLINTPPSASVIKKLASKAYNGVTPEDLLYQAGYIDKPNLIVVDKRGLKQVVFEHDLNDPLVKAKVLREGGQQSTDENDSFDNLSEQDRRIIKMLEELPDEEKKFVEELMKRILGK